MIADLVRRLPRPLRAPLRVAGVHTGRHRGERALPHGAAVDTSFRHCKPCGVDTAAVIHSDGSHTCTEGHTTVGGAA